MTIVACVRELRQLDVDVLDLGRVVARRRRLEGVQAADDDPAVLVGGRRDRRVAVDRALGGELAVDDVDLRDLHRHAGVQARGEAGADLEAEQAAAEQRVVVPAVVHDLRHDVDDRLGEALGRVLGAEDLRHAVVAERGGEVVGDVADDDGMGLAAELGGERAASETPPSEFLLKAPS